jgi:hypothetical protein
MLGLLCVAARNALSKTGDAQWSKLQLDMRLSLKLRGGGKILSKENQKKKGDRPSKESSKRLDVFSLKQPARVSIKKKLPSEVPSLSSSAILPCVGAGACRYSSSSPITRR